MSSVAIPVTVEAAELAASGRTLAARWGLPFIDSLPESGYALVLTPARLELRQLGPGAPGPVYVDFIGGSVGHRRRFGGGRGQPMARAAGLKGGHSPRIIDATAGLGRDAFVFASLGCEVILVERSPVVAALLADGLERAAAEPEVAPIVARMRLVHADTAQWLATQGVAEEAEVIYLDPMYPHREKSALVKKEMRLFREVVGDDPDADRLLPAALAAARERVVVKRPDYAPPLDDRTPTMAIASKKHRFDVYVIKALPH